SEARSDDLLGQRRLLLSGTIEGRVPDESVRSAIDEQLKQAWRDAGLDQSSRPILAESANEGLPLRGILREETPRRGKPFREHSAGGEVQNVPVFSNVVRRARACSTGRGSVDVFVEVLRPSQALV